MKNFLPFLVAAIAFVTPSAALAADDTTDTGLFNEDRVWSYRSRHYMGPGPYEIKMKFDGTSEYDGKVYHNYTNTLYFSKWNHNSLRLCDPILIREDEGKVYARLPKDIYVNGYEDTHEGFLTYDPATGLSEEVQLYDFRCPVGETFSSLSNDGERITLKVTEESTVEVGEESLRKIKVAEVLEYPDTEATLGGEWEIVENIGIVSENGFFAFCNNLMTAGYSDPTYMVGSQQDIGLVSYSDINGNVLLEGCYYTPGPEPESGLFNEDRVWSYIAQETFSHPALLQMKFEGTTEYEGVSYHNLINSYRGQYHYAGDDEWTITETLACPAILVRENEGKVFARIPQGYLMDAYDEIVYDPETHMSNEVQIYDFRCPVGESFNTLLCTGEIVSCEVTGQSTVEIDGKNLRKMQFSCDQGTWEAIEDLGVVSDDGFFAFMNMPVIAGSGSVDSWAGAGYDVELWKVTDTDGNIIYKAKDYNFPETEGVEGITDDVTEGDGVRYDLFGRRIREAAPGQIYIENGQKFVGQ